MEIFRIKKLSRANSTHRVGMWHRSRADSRVSVGVLTSGDAGSHGRSCRSVHAMGCVHDETGSWGSGVDPQERGGRFVSVSQSIDQ